MNYYRIRRGEDQAWLAATASETGRRLFWTDIKEVAFRFETLDQAELIAANLHWSRQKIIGPGIAIVEEFTP